MGKKVNGALVEGFLYRNQLQPAAWLKGDGTVRARFVYAGKPNVPEYMVTSTGATYRLITDQVGSVRLVVDATSGAVVERIDWDEFGNVLADSAPGTQPFGFGGGLRDGDTALARFGARDYDPVTGKWTAKDPLTFRGGSASLYGYAGMDPLNHSDATGLASCIYRIGSHTLTCSPHSGGAPQQLGPGGIFSGAGPCRDSSSPSCINLPDIGPIVPGDYRMNRDDRLGHDKFWRLEPIPKIPGWKCRLLPAQRCGFELHPGGRSAGCVTADKTDPKTMAQYDIINQLLREEDGDNWLQVLP